ncbi:MAG: peptidylprolyl isomerase [Pelagibacterales bacterium]|nr:peptidylprolyl isomerase [Pelagibacterales bacterium]
MREKFNLFLRILILVFFISSNKSFSQKVSIIYVVENTPITNIEINNEINYLLLINQELRKVDKKSLVQYASKSILKEKIKEIEVKKYFEFGQNQKIINGNLNKLMSSLNIKNENEFNKLLAELNLSINFLSKKIEIELIWNRLIYEMYKDKIIINEEKIKKNLEININDQSNKIDEFLLYEILFSPNTTSDLEIELSKIKKSINDVGFENTANIFSVSSSSKFGGKIGWVNKNHLSKTIIDTIQKLDFGMYSDPINVPTGKLILMIKDKRKVENNLSLEEELSKIITVEKNKQLNQFSSIYYKKVELDTKIYEK